MFHICIDGSNKDFRQAFNTVFIRRKTNDKCISIYIQGATPSCRRPPYQEGYKATGLRVSGPPFGGFLFWGLLGVFRGVPGASCRLRLHRRSPGPSWSAPDGRSGLQWFSIYISRRARIFVVVLYREYTSIKYLSELEFNFYVSRFVIGF